MSDQCKLATDIKNNFPDKVLFSCAALKIKIFACAGQLIVTTPIQAVKLPTTTVIRLSFPFDENELEKQPPEVFCKKRFF